MTLAQVALGDQHVQAHNEERDTINGLSEAMVQKSPITEPPFTATITAANTALHAPDQGTVFDLTLGAADCPITLPSGFTGAVFLFIRIKQPASGGPFDYHITNVIYDGDGVKPPIGSSAGDYLLIPAYTLNGGTNWTVNKGAAGSAYVKPAGGIPESDLATAVQTKLDAAGAGGGYVKPVGGIPETDLSSGVQTKLNSGGGAVVPGQIIASLEYCPNATQTDATIASTTMADFAAAAIVAVWQSVVGTTFDLTFTVPASGKVSVDFQIFMNGSSSSCITKVQLYDVGLAAVVPVSSEMIEVGSTKARFSYRRTITGLTPGSSVTYRPQWSSSATTVVSAGGPNGPVRFNVVAA